MTLSIGTQLGPYEILSAIGAGGMGEVYRAKDSRLDREVAVKVLPSHLTANKEFKQRFEREAKAISNLTHPNICTLHDIGSSDGTDYLVMELLDGETMARRLSKGALPIEQVLRYGVEIASALDRAHRADVVHRDLKPGNVMITKSGAKLLDFGLAKSVTGSGIASTPDALTVTEPLTGKGTIVGTFQYMAPEQLEGREADTRTDLFSFGAVLYEMATGQPAFSGKSRASLITSIMSASPEPIVRVQPMTPPALDHVVRMCLAKDPDDRIQTAHDVKLQLQWIAQGGSQIGAPAPVTARRRSRERTAWALAAVLSVATLGLSYLYFSPGSSPPRLIHSFITAPADSQFDFVGIKGGPPVLSRDGSKLAFVAFDKAGKSVLWVRPLDQPTARPLRGTDGAERPFWSADSESVGFFSNGKLKRVSANGGPSITLCDAPMGRGGTWASEGFILFAPRYQSPIHRISASGGTPTPITEVDKSKHSTHRWPYLLPDDRHFLYLAANHDAAKAEYSAVYFASVDGAENRLILRTESNAAYASGYLLFMQGKALMAQPFDPSSGTLSGEPVPVAQDVRFMRPSWASIFTVSWNGMLAFQTGAAGFENSLVWFDRTGKKLEPIAQDDRYFDIMLSPSQKKLAASAGESLPDIWVYDLLRGIRTRLTFEPAIYMSPVWSPDDRYVAFSNMFSDPKRIYRRLSSGIGDAEILVESEEEIEATDWSSNGRFLLYRKGNVAQSRDKVELWIKPLDPEGEPFPFLQTAFPLGLARFSPDGRWVAYSSNESGRSEVYVVPFVAPSSDGPREKALPPTGKWQISIDGGAFPVWRKGGKEIYYLSPLKEIMVAMIDLSEDAVEVTNIESLFRANTNPILGMTYDVSSDGQRFVVNTASVGTSMPFSLVTNWTEMLKKP